MLAASAFDTLRVTSVVKYGSTFAHWNLTGPVAAFGGSAPLLAGLQIFNGAMWVDPSSGGSSGGTQVDSNHPFTIFPGMPWRTVAPVNVPGVVIGGGDSGVLL